MAEDGAPSPLPGIVLGSELAASLQVHPDFNDEVKLVFPFGDISPTGEILPRVRRFRVAGIFDSGFYEYDSKFAIIPEMSAARLFGEYGRAKLGLYLKDASKSDQLKSALVSTFPERSWKISTWRERNQRLFQALLLERWGMFVLLPMIVLEKVKDMAVLRTVGLRLKQVKRIFWWQVAVIGLRGTLLGGILGTLVCLWFHFFPYELPPSYYIRTMPVAFDPFYIVLIVIMGPLISIVAGLYPARQACLPTIAEVIRYE
jgi:lipoprotein-releasing system permease protein